MADSKKKSHLTLWIVLAIVAAIATGALFPHFAVRLHLGGEVFLRMLTMMVVPLVMASVMSGILGLGDVRKLGRPGGYAILYYLSTTVLAVVVGLVMVNLLKPGLRIDESAKKAGGETDALALKQDVRTKLAEVTGKSEEEIAKVFEDLPDPGDDKPDLGTIFKGLALMLFTDNLFRSAVEMSLLPLIVFSIIFAGMLTTLGARVQSITSMIQQINEALMAFIMLLMKVAPLGIFCLVAARFGEAQAEGQLGAMLRQQGWYVGTVVGGLAFHALVTLSLLYWFFTRRNPFTFLSHMSQAILTAFSTASSTATLPVTMECAVDRAGISRRSTEFVLPLGATINMDGTALYEAAAAIFIAQVVGHDLGLPNQLVIAVTATLAAIGAAGIPEAGLVTMLIVLNAVGLPVEYLGLIVGVDWLLDRFRTAVNCYGDSVGAALIDQVMPQEEAAPVTDADK